VRSGTNRARMVLGTRLARVFRADPAAIAIAVCVAAFALFALIDFVRLFPLIEYRQWAQAANVDLPFKVGISRSLAFFTAALAGAVFGYVPFWHNLFQIALVTASGAFLGALLRRLFPGAPWPLAAGAVAFYLFTEAMLEALSWQATLLDKLAVLFTAAALYLTSLIDLDKDDRATIGTVNLAMLLLVWCAYNSKEAAWALVPSIVVLLAIRYLDRDGGWSARALAGAFRKSLTYLGASVLYAIYHIALVFAARSPAANAHNLSGNASLNLYYYILYMLNADPLARWLGVFPYAVPEARVRLFALCVILVAAAGVAIFLRAPRPLARWWVWALFSFLLAFVIPAQTQFASAFYLLVPAFYLAIFLFVTVLALMRAFPEARAQRITLGAAGVLLALHLLGFVQIAPSYTRVAVLSSNFEGALGALRAQLAQTPKPSSVVFDWPKSETTAYKFLEPTHFSSLAEYLLPRGTSPDDIRVLNAAITDQGYDDAAPPNPAPAPGTITVVLGKDLALKQIVAPAR